VTSRVASLVLICGLTLVGDRARAGPVTIKLGTLAPRGSSWDVLLREMAAEWSQASDGAVVLKVYPGGVAGNEDDMVRKMRIGQMQAAALTVVGLHSIEPGPQVMATPGLIGSSAEWEYVLSRAAPAWEKRFADAGFVVLMWADTGMVHMFLKQQITRPGDMQGVRVFAWAGDASSIEAFELAGFQPVVISSTDMLPALSTGMIDGYATTPVMALAARWYERTSCMTAATWGHLPGATIVRRETWEKIPDALRARLLAVARRYGDRVNAEVARSQADAIAAMQKNGLVVVDFDAAGRAQWQQIAERTWAAVRGGVVSAADFDEVKRLRDEFRAEHPQP
jgi:TRAP-type C4-dicarboxylate transport system substrate-binding protein